VGVEALWSGLVEGRSGIRPVSYLDVSDCACRVAGEALDFRPEDFLPLREVQAFARFVHLGVAAARLAWDDAGAPGRAIERDRIGVFMGSAVGASGRSISDGITLFEKGLSRVHPLASLQYPGSLPSQIAILLGLMGPTYSIGTACTAGADAIGLALGQVASGALDAAVVGGSDAAIFPLCFTGFDRLGALSRSNDPPEQASRPFSADRSGFVLSEGAGALVIEAEEVARARGARLYAELAGFGATCDAFHQLAPAPEGAQGVRAVELALRQAGMSADDVDYVNAHGTGTPKNDLVETVIMKRVFGERAYRLPISSSKSMTGHLLGASGAVELVISILALRQAIVPPTINVIEPDPACDLDYVTEGPRRMTLRAALSTSFGFGSRNAALVVRAMPQ
jgi:3-oxoacyl-[acyl-carrier-protein] synthase II